MMEFHNESDDFEFIDYRLTNLEEYSGGEILPLIKQTSCLIAAVVNNQIESLRLLLTPKWYNVRDKLGYNLLQIAIRGNCKEVFDYLLSLPDYPVDYVNEHGLTAVAVAFGLISEDDLCYVACEEYFAYELLQKNVDLNAVYKLGETPLHCALKHGYFNVAKLLIEKGTDINIRNKKGTPLELALNFSSLEAREELVCALLSHPDIQLFEKIVFHYPPGLQEISFLRTFDLLSECEIEFEVIVRLANSESWMFDEILELGCPMRARFDEEAAFYYFTSFCSMKIEYLRKIIEKFEFRGQELTYNETNYLNESFSIEKLNFHIENLNLLLNGVFKDFATNFIRHLKIRGVISRQCYYFVNNHEKLAQLYCFFLSYGFSIDEDDLLFVYRLHGYCELFKILLHMDYQIEPNCKIPFPRMIYDPSMNLEEFLEEATNNPYDYRGVVDELVHYFADRRLVHLHNELVNEGLLNKKENLRELPCLIELARNKFRDCFIRKFDLRTSKEFFTFLNSLPIHDDYRKILSYETKLY